MLSFKFTLLAVLSYVAITGATPLGSRKAVKAIQVVRRQTEDCGVDPDPTCLCEADPSLSSCPQFPAPPPPPPVLNPSCFIDPTQLDCQLDHAVRRQLEDCSDDPTDPTCSPLCTIYPGSRFCPRAPLPPYLCRKYPYLPECQPGQAVRRQTEGCTVDSTDPTCLCEINPGLSFCPQIPAPAPAPPVPSPSCIIDPFQKECELNPAVRRQLEGQDCLADPTGEACAELCDLKPTLDVCQILGGN